MDEKLRQTYLYDFYGELLNEHQRRIYEDFVFNDLSLGEIAQEANISRQGVSDLIRRCKGKLEAYESRLHLLQKFLTIREDVGHIHSLAEQFETEQDAGVIREIEQISNHILEEF